MNIGKEVGGGKKSKLKEERKWQRKIKRKLIEREKLRKMKGILKRRESKRKLEKIRK